VSEKQAAPLMPHATASWLVDNTGLTFEQIAAFCGLHILEVQAIADDTAATKLTGRDPIAAHDLTMEEIEKAQADPSARLELNKARADLPQPKVRKGPRYMPVSRRQDRPDAIAWLVRHHPELSDAQVAKLICTTKPTIQSVRDRTHWNTANIKPVDPVTLGLCTQIDLDAAVQKAAERLKRMGVKPAPRPEPTLMPAEESVKAEEQTPAKEEEKVYDPDTVFGTGGSS